MRYFKTIIVVFICALALYGVNTLAKTYTFAQVKVPAHAKAIDVATSIKENTSDQKFIKYTCRDTFSNDERAIEVRTYSHALNRYIYWVKAPKNSTVNISNGTHTASGTYTLQVRTEASKITGCELSGSWLLD